MYAAGISSKRLKDVPALITTRDVRCKLDRAGTLSPSVHVKQNIGTLLDETLSQVYRAQGSPRDRSCGWPSVTD
jgi:hypothetical protein